jgi:hypothetical protein
MHDVLRARLLRKIESLPEDQVYQVLDFIEFLESKYARKMAAEASGLQRFAENLEDKLRKRAMSPATLREAFQLIAAADRVLSGVSNAGKQLLEDLTGPGGEAGELTDGDQGGRPDPTLDQGSETPGG